MLDRRWESRSGKRWRSAWSTASAHAREAARDPQLHQAAITQIKPPVPMPPEAIGRWRLRPLERSRLKSRQRPGQCCEARRQHSPGRLAADLEHEFERSTAKKTSPSAGPSTPPARSRSRSTSSAKGSSSDRWIDARGARAKLGYTNARVRASTLRRVPLPAPNRKKAVPVSSRSEPRYRFAVRQRCARGRTVDRRESCRAARHARIQCARDLRESLTGRPWSTAAPSR